jgi:nitroreductase
MPDNSQTIQAIESRKSIRNFHNHPVKPSTLGEIRSWLSAPTNLIGPFGTQFDFELLIESGQGKERLGTYGFIKNAQGYIVGSSPKNFQALFEFGFVFEDLILFLTSRNIGTCWLAGTFDRQKLNHTLTLPDSQIIPAITPIGYPAKFKHFKERITRRVIKANQRKSADQLFFYQDFSQPLGGRGEDFHMALHYVRIAPSAKNMQPWRLVLSKDFSQVHFYLAKNNRAEVAFACDVRYLDIGIAYRHFKAGVDAAGISGKLKIRDPQISGSEEYEYITSWVRE